MVCNEEEKPMGVEVVQACEEDEDGNSDASLQMLHQLWTRT
jgi:hypothetical protein